MDEKDYFWRRNERTGKLECVSYDTGEVIAVQDSSHRDLVKAKEENLVRYEREDGSIIYLEKHLSLDKVLDSSHRIPAFSEILADEICQRIIEGGTITSIAADPRFPDFYTISKWRQRNPDFDLAIRHAFEARADYQHDKILSVAEGIKNKDEATTKRPLLDALKWSAEKGNPDQYGQRTKISGDKNAPISMVISTGVPAPIEPRDVSPGLDSEESSGNDEALSGGIEASGDDSATTDSNT